MVPTVLTAEELIILVVFVKHLGVIQVSGQPILRVVPQGHIRAIINLSFFFELESLLLKLYGLDFLMFFEQMFFREGYPAVGTREARLKLD